MDAILGSVGLPDRSPEGKVTDFLTHSSLPRETILFHPPRPRSTAARGQGGGWRDDQRWAQSSPYPWADSSPRARAAGFQLVLRSLSSFIDTELRKDSSSLPPFLLAVAVIYGRHPGNVESIEDVK